MLHNAVLAVLAVSVIGLTGMTAVSARGGGGGDYLPAVDYPLISSFSSPHRICHPLRQRVLTRYGWRLCRARNCG